MSSPMIIVVEGHSHSSKVAAELAKYLKYSHLNPEDVAPTLQAYLTSSSNQALSAVSQDLDNFSFKIVYEIASAQLRTKLGVVIFLPLLNHAHFDQLKQLANSQGVELLLVQCPSHDEILEEAHDAGGVRRLTVDTNKHFDVESFISAHLGQTFTQSSDPKDNRVKTSSLPASRENRTEETYRHLHRLVSDKPTNGAARPNCKGCGNLISESEQNYQCDVCEEYIFHQSCAELSGDLQKIRNNCPPHLVSKDPYFSKKQKCKICEKTPKTVPDDCHDCLFESAIRGKFLPVVVNHEAHPHKLNLIIMPVSYNYEYGCHGCRDFGKSISYRCYDCNYNLHVGCALAIQTDTKSHIV